MSSLVYKGYTISTVKSALTFTWSVVWVAEFEQARMETGFIAEGFAIDCAKWRIDSEIARHAAEQRIVVVTDSDLSAE